MMNNDSAILPEHTTNQEIARQAANAAGIYVPPTILPEGHALYASGVEKLKAARHGWGRLPNARTGTTVVKNLLAAEDRRDVFDVPVRDLRLHDANGRLYRATRPGAAEKANGYDSHAFRQLIGQIPGMGAGEAPRGFASSLLYLTDAERAAVVNARIGKAADATVTLRTKLSHNGKRIVRAVLSERYADVSDLHVAEGIERGLNGDLSTVKLDYRPGDTRSQFEMIWPSEIPVDTFRVGDIHYAFLAISNSETGQGSIRVKPGLFRAACANLTLAMGEGVEVTLRHMGDAERVRMAMRAAIAQAIAQVAPLVSAIQSSAKETIASVTTKAPSEILAAIAKKANIKPDRAAEWNKMFEKSYSMSKTTWGLTSAITEAAQQQDSWIDQQEEEELAGKVLNFGLRHSLERELVVVRR